MAAERQNIEFHAGDDKRLEVTVRDEDDAVVDLTGIESAKWSLAKTANSTALVTHTLNDNISVVAATSGRINIIIDAADTEGLRGVYYHEAEITDASGKTGTILYGSATILGSLNDPA